MRTPTASPDPRRAAWKGWLRRRMEEVGVSVRDVARTCGVGPSTVQSWRGGKMPPLSVGTRLARVLKVSRSALLEAASDEVREVVQG
ncbi:MAG TPA: helix-turn-helix transcriptional regulator [bacterium]|nr:helix-turn-helix transcriptional regulator [bacterium]